MNNTYLYIRKTSNQKINDELIKGYKENLVFIDAGVNTSSFKKMMGKIEENDEVVVRTFSHLGISSQEVLENLCKLILKGVIVTSIEEKLSTIQFYSWKDCTNHLENISHGVIGFLSAERLDLRRKRGMHVGRKKKQLDEGKLKEHYHLWQKGKISLQCVADFHHVSKSCISNRFRKLKESKNMSS